METLVKNRRSFVWIIAGMALVTMVAHAGQEDWLTDFEKARAEAREKSLPILADFAGTDWCGWCMKLNKEVFSQDEFKEYARTNLVLFLADYPRSRQLPAQTIRQNEMLMKEYAIEGFPTVLLLDSNGKELARFGYRKNGSKAYVDYLKHLIAGLGKDVVTPPMTNAVPATTSP